MSNSQAPNEPFPWDLGVHDAHCHPTDTMSSISTLSDGMRARTLTVMATRSQDQDLVADLARSHGIQSRDAVTAARPAVSHDPEKVIPSFGWHPWFSHQIYDDRLSSEMSTFDPLSPNHVHEKRRHYNTVLSPSPASKDDEAFIDELPDPQPLSNLIMQTRKHLEAHPYALVGEIGLDKAFRLPSHEPPTGDEMTPGRRNGQTLSPYRVNMEHQKSIFVAQLNLAGEMGRAVSVHGVQAPGALYETLKSTWEKHKKRVVSNRERRMIAPGVNEDFSSSDEDNADDDDELRTGDLRSKKKYKPKPFPPRICLHSFSGGVQTLQQYVNDRGIPARIFFSFSLLVNYTSGKHEHERRKHIADDVIRACPDDSILLESDLHTAGPEMDAMLEQIYRKACQAKAWNLRDGVQRIGQNFEEFVFG